jgi:hypothetical protein
MSTRGYTVIGWLTWQIAKLTAKRKLPQNKLKLGAAVTVLGVLVAGLVAAKAAGGGEES